MSYEIHSCTVFMEDSAARHKAGHDTAGRAAGEPPRVAGLHRQTRVPLTCCADHQLPPCHQSHQLSQRHVVATQYQGNVVFLVSPILHTFCGHFGATSMSTTRLLMCSPSPPPPSLLLSSRQCTQPSVASASQLMPSIHSLCPRLPWQVVDRRVREGVVPVSGEGRTVTGHGTGAPGRCQAVLGVFLITHKNCCLPISPTGVSRGSRRQPPGSPRPRTPGPAAEPRACGRPLSVECLPQDGGRGSRRGEGPPLLHPPPARKFPQPDRQHSGRQPWEGQQVWQDRSSAPLGHAASTGNTYFKKAVTKSKWGKPRPAAAKDTKAPPPKDQKAKSETEAAAGTTGGQKGAKGDGGPSADPKPRVSVSLPDVVNMSHAQHGHTHNGPRCLKLDELNVLDVQDLDACITEVECDPFNLENPGFRSLVRCSAPEKLIHEFETALKDGEELFNYSAMKECQ
ncbi:hypothetical protein GWK47_054222 [Chionoecetes opilio]|uniref:Uncharacterized protein n=1 Tax=Chionoecetes opilio TaxID=41210 RepID=A0A8J5CQT3_CHIOP|nr:hypothetical protein GWK47_054222 [Chionoecetes opilio]